jgi:ribosomal protein S21
MAIRKEEEESRKLALKVLKKKVSKSKSPSKKKKASPSKSPSKKKKK